MRRKQMGKKIVQFGINALMNGSVKMDLIK